MLTFTSYQTALTSLYICLVKKPLFIGRKAEGLAQETDTINQFKQKPDDNKTN